MRSHFMVFALTALLVLSIGVSPTFAQIVEAIVVTTEQSSYQEGDKIVILGEVREILSGYQVTIQVFEPNFGNRVYINQVSVGVDRTFSDQITAGGPLWTSSGSYKIMVLYGTEARTAEATFDFGGTTGTTPRLGQSWTVEGFGIGYQITGGSIISITPFPEKGYGSLVIEIDAINDGELTITLPREVIDAKFNGDDDDFIVLVDAEEWDFDETKTDLDRTLTIGFLAGTEEIEIIGTFVIPEFGTIAALILAVAIISIIAVSAKTRLSIIPRY